MKYCMCVQSLSLVQLFMTPWAAACQASLSFTIFCYVGMAKLMERCLCSHSMSAGDRGQVVDIGYCPCLNFLAQLSCAPGDWHPCAAPWQKYHYLSMLFGPKPPVFQRCSDRSTVCTGGAGDSFKQQESTSKEERQWTSNFLLGTLHLTRTCVSKLRYKVKPVVNISLLPSSNVSCDTFTFQTSFY